jgi:glycosyltransferase involved in cell wall biosynthesis/DNA-binding MarR family transcriptional regulator
MEPKVSIIVPVYNAEKSLARCVDSILNQEFRDFELILMDDGSKDRSGEICDGYARADARVVVVHKENTGVSDTRNQAIARARGTFLQFVDSDDWLTADATKLMVRAAEETGCDMVIADFYRVVGEMVSRKGDIDADQVIARARGTFLQFVDSDDWLTADATKLMVRAAEETGCDMVIADFYRVVGEMVSRKGDIDADQVIGREAFVGFMMENPADYYYGVLWNKLYRRSLVEAHGIRMDAKLSWCEDFLFNLEYVRYATTFYALRTPVYYYVKTKGSLVNQKISFARTVEMKLAMFECYNDFFKHVLDEDAYERKRLQVYHFLVDAAKDGFVFPATIPGTQKLGEERSQALQEVISEDGIIVEKYRDRKLLERYLESVALKYDMTLAELSLLLYRKDAGKALTRGAEAQMPAREDAVEATDRKDAGKALSRKDLAELMHMSRGDLRAALQKLVSRGMLEVVDVPRKRREAAEIAEATGLFGKRGEAQDADANGMTKKKREPRNIRLELLPASDAVLQDIAAAERDYEQAKFRGFTEDELRQYTALERRVQENEKQILQK